MHLLIGLDSFDSPFAGCTTHLASLILIELGSQGYQFPDYPRLVRLNPAVPWKTRGNGATAIIVDVDDEEDARHAAEAAMELAAKYDIRREKATAIAVLEDNAFLDCADSIYERAVHALMPAEAARSCIILAREQGVLVASYGVERRGVVGAVAALASQLTREDHTFELITYRLPDHWGRRRRVDPTSVIKFDLYTGFTTFLNYDYEEERVLITPHGGDPVLYGVRGERPEPLLTALHLIDPQEPISHWVIFRTNQATNRHLLEKPIGKIRPYDNPVVEARVAYKTVIRGGHVIVKLCDDNHMCIWAAFYRETGRLNKFAQTSLREGMWVRVGGGYRPHGDYLTLNAEFIELHGKGPTHTLIEKREGGEELSITVPGSSSTLVLPSFSAFHHLMKPPQRFEYRVSKPAKPVTPVYAIQEFTPG